MIHPTHSTHFIHPAIPGIYPGIPHPPTHTSQPSICLSHPPSSHPLISSYSPSHSISSTTHPIIPPIPTIQSTHPNYPLLIHPLFHLPVSSSDAIYPAVVSSLYPPPGPSLPFTPQTIHLPLPHICPFIHPATHTPTDHAFTHFISYDYFLPYGNHQPHVTSEHCGYI